MRAYVCVCVAANVVSINPLEVDRQRIRHCILHDNIQLFILECSSNHFNKMHISHCFVILGVKRLAQAIGVHIFYVGHHSTTTTTIIE